MPNTPTRMARVALGTTSSTLFTVPATTTSIITEIMLVNTSTEDRTATVTLAGLTLVPGVLIPPGALASFGMKQVLSAADVIAGLANGEGVNVFISGVNVSG